MEDKENLYDLELFGIRLAVVPAGKFTSEEGIEIEYGNRVKVQVNRYSLKITALQALGLGKMHYSDEFKKAVQEWALEEKRQKEQEMKVLDF
jgi:hypothetical protein